jgi:pimeloyl-ACP methyl ester carboxylesterase
MSKRSAVAFLMLAALAAPSLADAPALKTTELGKGPAIVLLPGLGSQRLQWMPTARRLIGSYKVVMADLPGHGDSPMPDPFSLEAAAGELDPVLAKLNADSTIVVAHGVGALIAVLEARAHPERMRGLIVIDAGLKSPIPVPDQQKEAMMDFINENYDSFLKMMFTKLGRDSTQGIELYSRAALVPSATIKSYMRQLLDADATNAAHSLKLPMLYVGSARGWPDTTSWATVAKAHGWDGVPNVQTRRIGNSGYLLMSDQPDSLAAAIQEFAKRVMVKS